MDDLLKERILRRLEALPDDKAHQVLDYIEFLNSKFSESEGPSTLERIADRVEDTMRAGRVSVSAIKGTRDVIDAAGRVMQGLSDAGRTVIDELQAPLKTSGAGETSEQPDESADQKPDAEQRSDDDTKESA